MSSRAAEATFELSIADVEFVVNELPQDDLYTREMWRWLENAHREREAEEERLAHGPGAVFEWTDRGLPKLVVREAPPGGWAR